MFELILMVGLGGLFILLGWRIWKNQQITLIHEYHYIKVTETDKKAYTEKIGKAMIIMGAGTFLSGVINFASNTPYGWIAFGICLVAGLVIMVLAQNKYNHGIF